MEGGEGREKWVKGEKVGERSKKRVKEGRNQ